ncbi:MAG: biotin/lipoyl-binding protein, partial [Gemmatimonadetes bacterium]|nr:biotin/lipoyl-binding protein [Gemmatimonadota bacterium]
PGQPLVVLEAMKMENELAAEQAGRVAAVHVEAGATVESGELLVELK